jgi:two-component system chemotaxis response regulator CheB
MGDLRVLVVDDSAMNRRTLSGLLRERPGVEVVGTASDGDEALRMANALSPDLITLDLEMPRMDGFTFLRLLMANRPTPVVVVSSHAGKENVFRALELGAIDFITKPEQLLTGNTEAVREQLDNMVAMVKQLAPASLELRRALRDTDAVNTRSKPAVSDAPTRIPRRVVAIAASTGGPTALMELFAGLPSRSRAAVVVAQHMPERFTTTFAERLDRASSFRVREAEHQHELSPRGAMICPGGRCMEVDREDDHLVVRVVRPQASDRYAPSADRLLSSVARAAGERAIGVVLTGMGDDASKGVVDIKRAGGIVLAEAADTAVVYGMPRTAQKTGCVDEVLPLPQLIERLGELVS